ncbi:hypothetical protein QQS21_012555 [Conoideocrella luteorostrata]|uniref:Uncharacterized protein n=1 Tax=Conoideocrella luteorostrata TaxID=1105319 RepID=A0AAJ0CBA3_9HYPO|nr:hypothetical protein QQS21_012555 [Conoideocrella luteorostrata]
MIQIQSLVSNTECPPESEEWLGIIRNNLFEGEGYSLYVAVFITKCTHVQATILSLLRRRDFVAAEGQYESMVEQLTAADDELQNYANTKSDYNEKFDIYMRNLYCSAIIKGYSYLLLLANFLTHHASSRVPLHQLRSERAQFVKMVRVAAQSILDSIPVALGPLKTGKDKSPRVLFDSIKMVWPLTAVYLVGPTLPEQKNQAEIALTFIGKVVGVRQALNTYPGKMPLPLEARVPLDLMPGEASSPASSK